MELRKIIILEIIFLAILSTCLSGISTPWERYTFWISYKIYCDLEAGPSLLPKKKYCDFTGLTSCYNELHTGIRYYNSQIYKISQNIPQPIKDQYLNIRKALIRLK